MRTIKNTVVIQKIGESYSSSCYESLYDGTNTLYASVLVSAGDDPRLEIYSSNALAETISLSTGQNDILINEDYYIASNTVKLRYIDNGYTSDFFEFVFPATLKGNMRILKRSTNIFHVQFKEQTGGSTTPHTLPVATEYILGGVKIGDNVVITSDGTISIEAIPVSVIDEICV